MNCSRKVAEQLEMDEKDVVSIILKSCISPGGQINISKQALSQLAKSIAIEVLSDFIISGQLTFPWKKYFVGDAFTKFKNLERYVPNIDTKPYRFSDVKAHFNDPFIAFITSNRFFLDTNKPAVITSDESDYININVLSDIFQEPARLKSTAGFLHPPPLKMWKDKKYHTFLDGLFAVSDSSGSVDVEILREEFYKVSRKSETSTFKCSVAKSVYAILGATRILDFSSGWGDRLLGALSLQDKIEYYVATDPNPDLYEGYNAMIQLAKPENQRKYRMNLSPFETFEMNPKLTFNCVFTSPPYFDYERYGDNAATQSIQSNSSFVEWVVNFLFFSLKKAWSHLEVGGHLALNISDSYQLIERNNQFTEITLLLIHAYLPGVEYKGVLSFAGSAKSTPRPIWTFRKNIPKYSPNSAKAKECIKKYYPSVWSKL